MNGIKYIIRESLFGKTVERPFAVFVVCEMGNGLYAATTRAKDRNESGRIGLPGGKVDPGEDPLEAVKRESYEEGWDIGHIDNEPIHKDIVDGKSIWWYSGKNAKKLSDYKEKGRITPIEVTREEIGRSGYGNDFLLESPLHDESNASPYVNTDDYDGWEVIDEFQINNLIAKERKSDNEYVIQIYDGDDDVGMVSYMKTNRGMVEEYISLKSGYMRKGIMSTIYRWIIDKYKVLISSASLTEGSFALWKHLSHDPMYKKMVLNFKNTTKYSPDNFDEETLGDRNKIFVLIKDEK